ncbi:radical SAM protein [Nodosilinea sp. AN01ver1]|uniref:radical SAM protein n=1 Tax=Nodosilinea sp. AN01ver1 TaxID=3423362 RepID=UPI003D31F2AE
MPISGCKGGVYRAASDKKGFNIDVVRQWHQTGHHLTTGSALYKELVARAKPLQLEIGIGNTCGLECQHCFLGYSSGEMIQELIPLPRLMETTTTMVEALGTRMVCVSDRDALTPKRSIPYFKHLAQLRQQYPNLKFGGITNGLTIHQYIDDLKRIKLDYLDISVDGSRHEHELFRGIGKFDLVLDNLRLALQHQIAERIMVAATLTRLNEDSVIRLITHFMQEEGVRWFDVSPLMAIKMQEYQLHENDLVVFLDSLTKILAPIQPAQAVTIFVEIPTYAASLLPSLVDRGWLIPEQLHQDRYGHLYQDIPINDMITLTLRPELISEYWRHTLRITADGYVIGGCESLVQKNYEQSAIGNIQSESIASIYERGIYPNSPFHQAVLSYDRSSCHDKPCFTHCLGGDSLLAKAVYSDYTQKDPNCIWNEYEYSFAKAGTLPIHSNV